MRDSNYDITRRRVQREFLNYDQEKMIRNFHLDCDEAYLYLLFCGREYRIDRSSGKVEWLDPSQSAHQANYNETMSIYDLLSRAGEDCRLSGNYLSLNELPGVVCSSGLGDVFFEEKKNLFVHRSRDLCRACERLGGTPVGKGDAGYRMQIVPFLPVILIFYDADDEFAPSLQFLWDERTLDFIHYETAYYIASELLDRISETMQELDRQERNGNV